MAMPSGSGSGAILGTGRVGVKAWAAGAALAVGGAATFPLWSPAPTGAAGLADWEGRQATYAVESDGHCPVTGIVVSVPQVDGEPGHESAWLRMTALRDDRSLFTLELLASGLDAFRGALAPGSIERYVLASADREPLEFTDLRTGRALLPRFEFPDLLPVVIDDPGQDGFAADGSYLGYPLRRLGEGRDTLAPVAAGARTLSIDTEVLIATSVSFRDDGSPRPEGRSADFTYVPLAATDYEAMIAAGFNVFRVPRSDLEKVLEEPVLFALTDGLADLPDLLYRSNYFGAVLYMDEPVARALNREMFAKFRSPEEVVRIVTEITRGRREADYGCRLLPRLLGFSGFGVGRLAIAQNDYPVWEAVPSAAWYELESGAAGWCYQDRLQPEAWRDLVLSRLGVEFPADAGMGLRFHHALLRGAARAFDAQWGVSIYGQMDPGAADLALPSAFDAGATYFWFWASDRDHHVPFTRQLELARALRVHVEESPRDESPREKTASARTAVALPWGYALDEFALGRYRSGGSLWGSELLELDDTNPEGARYGDVLRVAMQRCVTLLEEDELFDIVFWRATQRGPGYDRVYRILPTAEERVE